MRWSGYRKRSAPIGKRPAASRLLRGDLALHDRAGRIFRAAIESERTQHKAQRHHG